MKKKFLSNLVLIIFLNLIIKPFYILGIDAEIINRVGEFEYGVYFSIINLTFLLNIFLDLGVNNYNVKNISQHSFLVKKHIKYSYEQPITSISTSIFSLSDTINKLVITVISEEEQKVYTLSRQNNILPLN